MQNPDRNWASARIVWVTGVLLAAAGTLPATLAEPTYTWDSAPYCGWTKSTLVVLIIPPNDASSTSFVTETKAAVAKWQATVRSAGHQVSYNVYQRQDLDHAGLSPDVTITYAAVTPGWGGLATGSTGGAPDCKAGSTILIALVAGSTPMTTSDFYNFALHEFGHQVGLPHATGFGDLMTSSAFGGGGRLCISNLDAQQAVQNYATPTAPPALSIAVSAYNANAYC